MRERIAQLDFMRFVAITLVVIGHALRGIFFSQNQISNAVYAAYKIFDYFIYTFHVPVFFVISGYLVASKAFDKNKQTHRIVKLLKIYLLWFYLNAIVAIIFSSYINRDIGHRGIVSLLNPLNPGSIMWFLLALVVANIIFLLSKNRPAALYLTAAVSLILLTLQFDYSGIAYGTFWFFVGVLLPVIWSRRDQWQPLTMLGPAVVIYVFASTIGYIYGIPTTANFVACAAALVALYAAGSSIGQNSIVTWIGANSLAIYVMHIFFVAGVRIFFVKVLNQNDLALLIISTSVAGVFVPLLLLALARKTKADRILMLG